MYYTYIAQHLGSLWNKQNDSSLEIFFSFMFFFAWIFQYACMIKQYEGTPNSHRMRL